MKLTVIVTCYNQNRDDLIKKCVDSVIDYRVKDTEFLLIDDCSTDGSYEILKTYEEKYPSLVRVIKNEVNKGAGGARNTGIKEARGEYISYIDGDDFVSEGFFYNLLNILKQAGDVDLVGPKYAKTTYEGNFIKYEAPALCKNENDISSDIKKTMLVKGERSCGRLYKKSIIVDNNLFFPENIAFEDSPVTCYWTNLCDSYAQCDEAIYYYRKTAKSLTTSKLTPKKTDEHYMSQLVLIENGKRLGLYEKYQNELDYRLFRRDFNYKLKECVLSFNDSERDEYYTKVCKLFLENTTDLVNNPYIDKADKKKLNEFLENPIKFGKKQSRAINFKFKFLGNLAKIKHFIIRK